MIQRQLMMPTGVFVKYNFNNNYLMQIARKPNAFRDNTISTRDQISQTGCCFTTLLHSSSNNSLTTQYRSYSEPKQKKINLTIARRGHTQEKNPKGQGHLTPVKGSFSSTQLKHLENVTGFSSLTSKITTQKNSLRNSRTKPSIDKEGQPLTLNNRYQRFLNICSKQNLKQMEVTFSQTKGQIANGSIQMLSQISMVEQELISHDSTLKALNFMSIHSEKKSTDKTGSPNRFHLETIPQKRYEDVKDVRNPLQRLLQKRRLGRPECERQKLHL